MVRGAFESGYDRVGEGVGVVAPLGAEGEAASPVPGPDRRCSDRADDPSSPVARSPTPTPAPTVTRTTATISTQVCFSALLADARRLCLCWITSPT